MNIFAVGAKLEKLKHDVLAEEPKVVAFFEKVEKIAMPIIEAIVAELVSKGTITQAQVDEFNALEHEAAALFTELEPLLEDAKKLG